MYRMANQTLIFVLLFLISWCRSTMFRNLSEELRHALLFVEPKERESFAQISKPCLNAVDYYESMEQETVSTITQIITNMSSTTFDQQIQIIAPLASELFHKRSKVFFTALPDIVLVIKQQLLPILHAQQITNLLNALNVYSADKITLTSEVLSNSMTCTNEQFFLIIASRAIVPALFPFDVFPHSDMMYRAFPDKTNETGLNTMDPTTGSWVYTFAVMYEHWITHYRNASDKTQQIMVEQYHFIPWSAAFIKRLKA
eukprot:19327_1